MKINELTDNTITLYHGGRNLQFNHHDMLPAKHGRWEMGPGLYCTTHYDTAKKYAKGGGTVYKITINRGARGESIKIPTKDAIDFVNRYVIGKHKQSIISYLSKHYETVPLSNLINLCINSDALTPKNTIELRKFLISKGADYDVTTHYGGRDETVFTIYNPSIIAKVTPVKSTDIKSGEWELTGDYK